MIAVNEWRKKAKNINQKKIFFPFLNFALSFRLFIFFPLIVFIFQHRKSFAAERLALPAAGGTRLAHETDRTQSCEQAHLAVRIQPSACTLC
jgi:hypothetical protein